MNFVRIFLKTICKGLFKVITRARIGRRKVPDGMAFNVPTHLFTCTFF